MNKHELRLAYKARRQALTEEECIAWTKELTDNIASLNIFKKADCVLAYLAMPKEANLDLVIQYCLDLGKKVYVPVCIDSTTMVAARLHSLKSVSKEVLSIRIPIEPHELIDPRNLDLVLMPGVAFDELGHRIGMGAGYYDRFMEDIPLGKRVGIAWHIQIHKEELPVESHDEQVTYIVTNKEVIRCRPNEKGEQN